MPPTTLCPPTSTSRLRTCGKYGAWVVLRGPGTIPAPGWFTGCIYSDWFHKSWLPTVQRWRKYVLIGDNLSSHISVDVINTCKEKNFAFICLPPNSTDKLQPLDIGYFGPLKSHWRSMLQGILGWCLCTYPTYTISYLPNYPYL
jgi:hypothetical protein